MAKAASTAPAKDKALEADILNEGAKAAGAVPVNQQEVKDAAQNLGNAPATGPINEAGQSVIGSQETMAGTPGPGVQLPNQGNAIPPVTNQANADEWGEKEKDAAIAAANAEKNIRPANTQPFMVPQYLNENPVKTQEEIDAIAAFLQAYRAGTHAPVAAPADSLEKQFGAGYVVAIKNGEERPFTRMAWDRMGGNKNQDGWREVVKVPKEVKDLQAKKAAQNG
jgi:hypothetical protein